MQIQDRCVSRDIQSFDLSCLSPPCFQDPGHPKGVPLYGFGLYFAERITKARVIVWCESVYINPLLCGDTQWSGEIL